MKMRASGYAIFLLPMITSAQQTSTTSGPCSPIAPNNSGTITIQCGGISSKLANQLLEMMNRIAKDRDPDAIMKKLDNILKGVNEIREAASPREFSKGQHDRLISLVKQLPAPLSSNVVFDSVVGNAEAQRYGNHLSTALSDALGRDINMPAGLSTCLECVGVWVCVNDNATVKTSNDGKAIREVFELSGVEGAKFCTDPRNGLGTTTTVKVLIGPKEPAVPKYPGVKH